MSFIGRLMLFRVSKKGFRNPWGSAPLRINYFRYYISTHPKVNKKHLALFLVMLLFYILAGVMLVRDLVETWSVP